MKQLSYALMMAGLLLLLFPSARDWYFDQKQERLLTQLEQKMLATNGDGVDSQVEAEYTSLSELFKQEANAAPFASEDTEMAEPEETPPAEEPKLQEAMESLDERALGIIQIDKINVKLPVMEGATQENMKYAAAHMTETTPIGEVGNAAIAAHRSRTKGRLFNRLNEVEIGDELKVLIRGKEFVYTVFNVSVVEPTDVSVLSRNDKDSLLTLITCEPLVNPTHRLIVHAKLNHV